MCTSGDTVFNAIGFTLVFVASALGGYRWALTEVLMQMIGTKMNSLMTIYTISPASALILLPFAAWLEWGDFFASKFYTDPGLFFLAVLNLCGSGVFAFAMIYVELAVLNRTSSLSLVIISYFKQCTQIILSVIVFHEVLSPLNVGGVVVTFVGMFTYAYVKHQASMNKGALEDVADTARKRVKKMRAGTHHVPSEQFLEASTPLASSVNHDDDEEEEDDNRYKTIQVYVDDAKQQNKKKNDEDVEQHFSDDDEHMILQVEVKVVKGFDKQKNPKNQEKTPIFFFCSNTSKKKQKTPNSPH